MLLNGQNCQSCMTISDLFALLAKSVVTKFFCAFPQVSHLSLIESQVASDFHSVTFSLCVHASSHKPQEVYTLKLTK